MPEFILFDMIGTTINDSGSGSSLVVDCLRQAFSIEGIVADKEEVNHQRGKSKKEAILNILHQRGENYNLANNIYLNFIGIFQEKSGSLTEIDGTGEVFRIIREKRIKAGLGSGLPLDLIMIIVKNAGWRPENFDFIGSSEDFGKGRPDPVMINKAIDILGITDRKRVLKVGDTIADILEGKNAGVLTAAVLTGSQKEEDLKKFEPDYIFTSIRELPSIL